MTEKHKTPPFKPKLLSLEVSKKIIARAKSLLVPSPEKLKEMPTTSKRVH